MNISKKNLVIIIPIILIIIGGAAYFTMRAISDGKLSIRTPIRILHDPKVTWAEPEVDMSATDDGEWVEVEPGLKLDVGSYIRTGHFGSADISFAEGTLVRVAEDTILSISELTLSKVDLSLEKGSIISKFRKITGHELHRIKTPTVVCGIRGTELIVEIKDDYTTVFGMSGVTEVASIENPDSPVLLGFQQKSISKKGEDPELPVDMSPQEIARYRRILDSMHSSEVFFITSDINFQPDSAELATDTSELLEELASTIKRKGLKIEIVGHTADIGNSRNQYELSKQRAETVKDAFISMGIKKDNLKTSGYGGSRPIADNNTNEGRAVNRRVEFIIIE
ncbi:MAG TPA: hypothetical protein DCO79_07200 [Spirochaeta sp.]|nr:hypothetical protein [Spirochaeta sp.]